MSSSGRFPSRIGHDCLSDQFVCGFGPRPQTKHLGQHLTHSRRLLQSRIARAVRIDRRELAGYENVLAMVISGRVGF
jgi:hypothetical protein